MRKTLCLTILIAFCLSANAPSTYKYWLQIKASPDQKIINQLHDSLLLHGLNSSVSQTLNNHVQFFRLRIGPASDSICLKNIRNYFAFGDSWIVREICGNQSVSFIQASQIDTISSVNKAIYVYLSKEFPANIIQIHNFGIERAVFPADLRVYFFNGKRTIIGNTAGFVEKANSLLLGKLIKIYSDPSEKGIGGFSKEISLISKLNKIPVDSILARIMFLNGGIDAYLTTLMKVNENGDTTTTNQIGFDFVDTSGLHIKYTGMVDENKFGNALAKPVDYSSSTFFQSVKSIVFIKPISAELITILAICNK
jgi:hypothetical protein